MRPVLWSPYSWFEIILEIAAGVGLFAGVIAIARNWRRLGARVPIHFGGDGEPDNWGNGRIFVAFPIVAAVLYAGLSISQRYPHTYNYPVPITAENAERLYDMARTSIILMKAQVVWLFVMIERTAIRAAFGEKIRVWRILAWTAVMVCTVIASAVVVYLNR